MVGRERSQSAAAAVIPHRILPLASTAAALALALRPGAFAFHGTRPLPRAAPRRSAKGACILPRQLRTEGAAADDEATYFSPNRALDPTKFRYDLESIAEAGVASPASPSDEGSTAATGAAEFNEYSFFDEAMIYVRAGSGGQGASTYRKGVGGQDGVPDGGNGGRGGDVWLEADESLNTLAGLTDAWRPNAFGGGGAARSGRRGAAAAAAARPRSFRAENGRDGARQYRSGRYGKDAAVRVPPGTVVQEERGTMRFDPDSGDEAPAETELVDVGAVTLDSPRLLVARGGDGGEGSAVSSSRRAGRGVRRPRQPPAGGERKRLKLTLKIVADVALVGVPNSGKSTLLAAVTRAKPKIANYPFTTVVPNLGVWAPPGDEYGVEDAADGAGSAGLVLCDVPGLIAGAAEGVGLGHAFLRHVERCHVILHLVDATSADPIGDFHMLNREILRYGNGKLARMPQIVVVNKIDAWEDGGGLSGEGQGGDGGGGGDCRRGAREGWERGLRTRMDREELERNLREAMTHSRLMWMSAKNREGVDDLMGKMAGFVRKVKDMKESEA